MELCGVADVKNENKIPTHLRHVSRNTAILRFKLFSKILNTMLFLIKM